MKLLQQGVSMFEDADEFVRFLIFMGGLFFICGMSYLLWKLLAGDFDKYFK